MIRLTFHGAARTVTGSCYLLDTGNARVLIDCGMFQGSKTERELNYRAFPFEPSRLTAVLLTHAHIDHAGLLPKLVKHGYGGRIHCTAATADLCAIMLPDSGGIQEMEVKQLNQRRMKRGEAEAGARIPRDQEPHRADAEVAGAVEQDDGVRFGDDRCARGRTVVRRWRVGHVS